MISAVNAVNEVHVCNKLDNGERDSGSDCSTDTVNRFKSVPILKFCSMIYVILVAISGCYIKTVNNTQSINGEN